MRKIITLISIAILLGWSTDVKAQAFTFAAGQLTYNETFDGMGPTGTTYLNGWTAIRYSGSGAIGEVLVMAVTDGASNSGGIYNVGTDAMLLTVRLDHSVRELPYLVSEHRSLIIREQELPA